MDGALFHHLRACREFATHAMRLGDAVADQELLSFLLEVYLYFELLGALRSPSDDTYGLDPETVEWCLNRLAGREESGFLLGCARDLYRLIPRVSEFGLLRQRELSAHEDLGCASLYDTLQNSIAQWQVPHPTGDSDVALHGWTDGEITAATILQNTLMVVLQAHYFQDPGSQDTLTQQLEPLIDHTLLLQQLITGEWASSVTYWPLMIMGCSVQSAQQQAMVCELLEQKQLGAGMPILDRAVEVLGWVWEEARMGVSGLQVLDKVCKMRHTDLCLG